MNHTASVPFDGVTPPLEHLGVIRVLGEDAASFIHGQLTQDFALQKPDQARLAAFLNAKGRMQASFIGIKRAADEILLICSRDLLPQTLKRLSMFVLRAKAKLSDASGDFVIHGMAGSAAPAGAAPWSVSARGDASVVQLYPADGQPRALLVAPVGSPAPQGQPLSLALWQLSEVRSGVATLTQPIFEAFVPQMVNYESVGGVNFKKGCYPGQEVVARSQFRGAIKRRAFVADVDGSAEAGQEVFDASAPDQPVGLIAQAAPAPSGGTAVIVSLQLSAEHAADLRVRTADGPKLADWHLPFPLLLDI